MINVYTEDVLPFCNVGSIMQILKMANMKTDM